jgi:hypothetical protein
LRDVRPQSGPAQPVERRAVVQSLIYLAGALLVALFVLNLLGFS